MLYSTGMPSRSGSIHVATTGRFYKGTLYRTHLLRRSYRVGSQVKHETLGNISHLPEELIELIRRFLAGERFVEAAATFQIERSLPHGHVEAVLGMIGKLELDRLIYSKRCRERDLVLAMIVERLLDPCSKLATTRVWHESTLAEELSVADANEDDLYAALDWLLHRQPQIEKKLAARHLSQGSRVLYDVSSSYYEGRSCRLALFGHDRDGQKGLSIIVYGVLTDAEGRPLAVDVYPGNTGDPTTLADQVDKLRQRFGLERVVLVGDRGLLTRTQLGTLKQYPGLGWISALRSTEVRRLVESGCLQLSLFDQQNLAEIDSPDFPGERLVACHNPLLAAERARKRQELLAATETELSRITRQVKRRTRTPLSEAEIGLKVGRVLNRYKMAKHFTLQIADGQFQWVRNLETIQCEQQLDGLYVIRTSEPEPQLSAPNAVRHYKSLSQVEQAFRCLKGTDLRVRPIYHRTEDHVRAHIFLCLLAYYVEWHLRQALAPLLFADPDLKQNRASRDPVATAEPSAAVKAKKAVRLTAEGLPVHSFNSLLQALATRCRNTCRVKATPSKASFSQLTEPTPLQARAYQLLGL
jgi:transposase